MTRKKPLSLATVSSAEKKNFSSATASPVVMEAYQQVTKELVGLWQDHLKRMSQHAEQIQKVRKAAAPVFSFYACSMNIWVNLAEACGRSVWPVKTFAAGAPVVKEPESASEEPMQVKAPKQVRPATFKRASSAKSKVIEEALPGEMALADLARRVAEMERERGQRRPSSSTVVNFKETAGQKMTRPSEDN
jgi:hypothetical protein